VFRSISTNIYVFAYLADKPCCLAISSGIRTPYFRSHDEPGYVEHPSKSRESPSLIVLCRRLMAWDILIWRANSRSLAR
jgi:hypothetical protein